MPFPEDGSKPLNHVEKNTVFLYTYFICQIFGFIIKVYLSALNE